MEQWLIQWAAENLLWAGSTKTNKSSRDGYKPSIIVDHISEGTTQSCIDWFNDTNNKDSSAHFLVSKNGKVYQFIDIGMKAWSNGLIPQDISKATAKVVKEQNVNPNLYTVSIEHEGVYEQTKGLLTQAQLKATQILHKYIIQYVKDNFGVYIVPSRETIIGHYEINPIAKPDCPGHLFQFDNIISYLKGEAPKTAFSDIEGHWAERDIEKAKELGLISGYTDGRFGPDDGLTRAQAAVLMVKLYNKLNK